MAEQDTSPSEIELFTEAYWIVGRLPRDQASDAASLTSLLNLGEYGLSGRGLIESGRLVDILNRDTGYVSVAGAAVRSLDPAGQLERTAPEVAVHLAEVLCASPSTQVRSAPAGDAPAATAPERERRRVEVQAGSLLVTGDLHIVPGSDPVAAFFQQERTFVALTSATATYLPDPERRWERDVLIVNSRRTQLMSVAPVPTAS